ncbi:ABC transporter ATP-binding protein [Alsobacter sp. KACC 23698]|uniref:ABC transporter ATP-binding protein n=1 Tax=Alsobacter sp. KACC 23698 TaxID=3149229 RepID=A0AAU7JEL3_9HYPH
MSSPAPSAGRSLVLDGVTHRYGDSFAVRDINLDIRGGELVSLLGPSGCGKTTLLRIIAGFVAQTEGRVIVGEEIIDDLPPSRRAVGIVFQNYALFPHMTIAENVAYGLAARGADKATQRAEAQRMLDLVQLGPMGDRLPRQLSGGQQQRVALARALAIKPSILLLDEPFAALDKNLRLDMQIEVKRLQRLSGITTVLVTHDQEEALSMSDRVAVLSQGRLEQFASPTAVYDAPETLFVNTFVGSANLLPGVVLGADAQGVHVRLDAGADIVARAGRGDAGERVVACIRPEHLRIENGEVGFSGVVEMALPLGSHVVHDVRTAGGLSVKVSEPRLAGGALLPTGAAVRVRVAAPGLASIFPQAA